MFTCVGFGGKVRAYNLVGVGRVCLDVFDPADDCSIRAVLCVERFLVYCLVTLAVFLVRNAESFVAVPYCYVVDAELLGMSPV